LFGEEFPPLLLLGPSTGASLTEWELGVPSLYLEVSLFCIDDEEEEEEEETVRWPSGVVVLGANSPAARIPATISTSKKNIQK
jgi:hypothetical protein